MHDTTRQLGWIIWRKLIIFHPVTFDGKKTANPRLRIGATSLKKRLHPHGQQLASEKDAIWVGVMIFWPSILKAPRQTLSQFYHSQRTGLFLAIQTSKMWGQEMA